MIPKNFEEALKYGKTFETIVTNWLIDKGYYVSPKYLFKGEKNNQAPVLLGKEKDLTLPDIDAAKDGKRVWFECKRKLRMFKHPATGVSCRLYNNYKKVQEETGTDVFIIFWDYTNEINEIYGNYLKNLERHIYSACFPIWNKNTGKKEPHVLFKYPQAFYFIEDVIIPEGTMAEITTKSNDIN